MLKEIQKNKQFYLHLAPVTTTETLENITRKINNLLPEVTSPYYLDVWKMGDIVCNTIRRPLFYYSRYYSLSFFPTLYPPNPKPPIVIAQVSMKGHAHFVGLRLNNPIYPIPLVGPHWKHFAKSDCSSWVDRWESHLQLTTSINASHPHPNKSALCFPSPDKHLLPLFTLPKDKISVLDDYSNHNYVAESPPPPSPSPSLPPDDDSEDDPLYC